MRNAKHKKTVAKIHLEYSISNTCTSVFKYFRFEMYSQHCLQLSYKTLSSPYYRLQGRLYNNKANCLHFAPGGTLRHRRGWRIYQNSCFNINLKTVCVKESSACAGQWIKCHQHRFQLELCQIKQFRTTMHQNASGGRAGKAYVLPQPQQKGLPFCWERGRRREEGKGRDRGRNGKRGDGKE